MGKFGWSLPPGCGTLPGEEDEGPCMMCGNSIDNCICPSCPVCTDVGNPKCYEQHGMERSKEQIDSLAAFEKQWAEDNAAQADAEAKINQEEKEYFDKLDKHQK